MICMIILRILQVWFAAASIRVLTSIYGALQDTSIITFLIWLMLYQNISCCCLLCCNLYALWRNLNIQHNLLRATAFADLALSTVTLMAVFGFAGLMDGYHLNVYTESSRYLVAGGLVTISGCLVGCSAVIVLVRLTAPHAA